MTAGFQAFTDTGLYQIDGETENFALSQHVTLTTSAGQLACSASNTGTQYSFTAQIATFDFYAVQPIVAFYAPGQPVTMVSCISNGGNSWRALFWAADATSFDVYVFDQLSQIPASNARCGLQVFNSSGVLIADAALPMLRPIAWLSGNVAGVGPGWGEVGWPGSRSQDYSQPGRQRVATAAVVTASAQASMSTTNSNGSDCQGWLGLTAWRHADGGSVVWSWIMKAYRSTDYYPSNYAGYGSMLDWSGLLIDVSYF